MYVYINPFNCFIWRSLISNKDRNKRKGCRGRDHIVVGFTDTYVISAYHHTCCLLKHRSWRGVLDTTLCDKVCQWLATCRWFSPGTLVFPVNKTDRHDIAEMVLKVALNTINLT